MTPVSPVLDGVPVESEVVFAKNQPQYRPLPVLMTPGPKGMVTSRGLLTWRERLRILFGASIYIQQLTFGSQLQPIAPGVGEPYINPETY